MDLVMSSKYHVESKTVEALNFTAGENARASDFDSRRPPKAISASEGRRCHYMVFKMTAIINLVGTESIFGAF